MNIVKQLTSYPGNCPVADSTCFASDVSSKAEPYDVDVQRVGVAASLQLLHNFAQVLTRRLCVSSCRWIGLHDGPVFTKYRRSLLPAKDNNNYIGVLLQNVVLDLVHTVGLLGFGKAVNHECHLAERPSQCNVPDGAEGPVCIIVHGRNGRRRISRCKNLSFRIYLFYRQRFGQGTVDVILKKWCEFTNKSWKERNYSYLW